MPSPPTAAARPAVAAATPGLAGRRAVRARRVLRRPRGARGDVDRTTGEARRSRSVTGLGVGVGVGVCVGVGVDQTETVHRDTSPACQGDRAGTTTEEDRR